jgi:hypothetical protein
MPFLKKLMMRVESVLRARILGGRHFGLRLGLALPGLRAKQALLGLADCAQVVFELLPVRGAQVALEAIRFGADRIQDAVTVLELLAPLGLLVRLPFEEQLHIELGGSRIRRDLRAAAGPRQSPPRLAQRQEPEARLQADLFGGELVERDRVPEAGAVGMRRRRQEGLVGIVAAVDARMRRAGDDRQVLAVSLDLLEIRRQRIVASGRRRHEVRDVKS